MHAAFAVIAQIEFGEGRLVAPRERRLGAALSLQPGQREFEMLAGAQFAGGIVGARTEIAARSQASLPLDWRKIGWRVGARKLLLLLHTDRGIQASALGFPRALVLC